MLSFHGVTVSRGPLLVLDRVDLTVSSGRRVGVVGPNGVGKSTLLATAAGSVVPDEGVVRTDPMEATVGWLVQEPDRRPESVHAFLERRTGVAGARRDLERSTGALADGTDGGAEQYERALERWLALGAPDFDARVGSTFDDLGIPARVADSDMPTLSGGEAARVGLAALHLSRFDVHLLDEPTNDLDLAGLDILERWLLALSSPVLLVSHDRRFLERVVTDVAEIDQFTHRVSEFGGGWTAYLDERETARRHACERYEEYDAQRRDLSSRAQRQREWAQ